MVQYFDIVDAFYSIGCKYVRYIILEVRPISSMDFGHLPLIVLQTVELVVARDREREHADKPTNMMVV